MHIPVVPRSCQRQPGSGGGGKVAAHRDVCGAGSQALHSPQAPGTMEMLPGTAGAELSPRRESMTNHSLVCETTDQWSGCHWLLVQSMDGQKHLNKLSSSMDVWMLNAWAGPASHHPQLHNLQSLPRILGSLMQRLIWCQLDELHRQTL